MYLATLMPASFGSPEVKMGVKPKGCAPATTSSRKAQDRCIINAEVLSNKNGSDSHTVVCIVCVGILACGMAEGHADRCRGQGWRGVLGRLQEGILSGRVILRNGLYSSRVAGGAALLRTVRPGLTGKRRDNILGLAVRKHGLCSPACKHTPNSFSLLPFPFLFFF